MIHFSLTYETTISLPQIFIHYEVGIKLGNFLCDENVFNYVWCAGRHLDNNLYGSELICVHVFQNNTLNFSHSVSKALRSITGLMVW